MSELAFHFGATDKLAYACRLLRKAAHSGAQVVVVADAGDLARLDADLWALSPTDFVPHCMDTEADAVRKYTPIVFTRQWDGTSQPREVMVNLGDTVPDGYQQFARLIEVVSTDTLDRENARARWKFYTERGHAITRHDLALRQAE